MIGMTLLGMVMAASLMALPEIRALNFKSDAMRMAYSNLNSELENLRTQTFDQLSTTITSSGATSSGGGGLGGLLGVDSPSTPTSTQSTHTVTQNRVQYTVQRELSFLDSEQKLLECTVTVLWVFDGQTKSVSGRAIFTKDGLSDKKFGIAN